MDVVIQIKSKFLCPALLAFGEMKIRTTMIYHSTPIRMIKMKIMVITPNTGGCTEYGSLIHC